MRSILVLALKEWDEFRRDSLSLALAFLLPVLTLLLFGYGVRLQARNIPACVKDLDRSPASRMFGSEVFAANAFIRAGNLGRISAEKIIQDSQTRAVVVIPEGFQRRLDLGKQARVELYIDGSDINSAKVVRSAISGVSASLAAKLASPGLDDFFVLPELRIWFNPGLKEALFVAPGVFAVIFWMYPSLLAAVAVSKEMEQGTIIQSYASGLSAPEFLLGKSLFYIVIGLVQAAASVGAAQLLFGLELKVSLPFVLLCTTIYLFAAVFFGLAAGIYTKHQTVAVQAAATGGFFPSLLLSGFVYPISNIPFPLSLICNVVPARYYIEISRDAFSRAEGCGGLWPDALVLLGFALLLFILAWSGIHRMQVSDL